MNGNSDAFEFAQLQDLYRQGQYAASHAGLRVLCSKYAGAPWTEFTVQLFFCYETAASSLGLPNPYAARLHDCVHHVDRLLQPGAKDQAYLFYALSLLRAKRYADAYPYLKYIQPVRAPNIAPDNMGFFRPGDAGKTLLVYMSGGIGDRIMYARFVFAACRRYPENRVLFLADDSLCWIFRDALQGFGNVRVIPYSERYALPAYDYHCNVIALMAYLEITYGGESDVAPEYYLRSLSLSLSKINTVMDGIILPGQLNVVVNWHGNYENAQEKFNRGMPLTALAPLLSGFPKGVRWISVQKEVSAEERKILRAHGVADLSYLVDRDGDSYRDTLWILKNADLVITTDTSLAHIAGTACVNCWTLLTAGCDWRWTQQDKSTAWYPRMKLVRQRRANDWSSVVNTLTKAVAKIVETRK